MLIEKSNVDNSEEIKAFLKRIPGLNEIDDEIFDRILILKNEFEIKAIISYECFTDKGLIRCFIFQKDVEFDDLNMLMNEMIKNAKKENIGMIITIIEEDELKYFFEKLGFKECLIDNIYIREMPLISILGNSAIGMIKEI